MGEENLLEPGARALLGTFELRTFSDLLEAPRKFRAELGWAGRAGLSNVPKSLLKAPRGPGGDQIKAGRDRDPGSSGGLRL